MNKIQTACLDLQDPCVAHASFLTICLHLFTLQPHMLSFYPANTPTVFPHSQDPLPGPFSLGAHKAASCSLFRLQISVPCWGGLPDHPPTPTHKECRCLIWLFSWHTAPEKLCYLFVDLLIAYLPSLKYALSCSELHYQHLEIWSLNKYWMNITEYTCFLTTKRNDNTSLAVLLRELNEKMNIKCWPQCLKHSKSLMFGFFFFFYRFWRPLPTTWNSFLLPW